MDTFTFSMMKLAAGSQPRRFVVMGVSGSGKSTIGKMLAERIGGDFIEGDELHPAENVAKMQQGIALVDADRWPWLDRFAAAMRQARQPAIGACSALKRSYRDRIRAGIGGDPCFILLHGDRDLLAQRMTTRSGHFMPASLLESQLRTLEAPSPEEAAIVCDVAASPDEIVGRIMRAVADSKLGPA